MTAIAVCYQQVLKKKGKRIDNYINVRPYKKECNLKKAAFFHYWKP